jgi:hypothetical protein
MEFLKIDGRAARLPYRGDLQGYFLEIINL